MSRQDQYPCAFDGTEALHCCLPSAAGIEIKESIVTIAVQTIDEMSFII